MKVYARADELVCHFSVDEDFIPALEGFEGGAFVFDATGAMRDIDLEGEDGDRRKVGAAEILSLRGVVQDGQTEVHGTFLRGTQAIGGRVWGARIVRCIARGAVFASASASDHFRPEPMEDMGVNPSAANEIESGGASEAASAAPGGGWAAAIAASEAAQVKPKAQRRERRSAPMPGSIGSRLAPPTVRSAKSRVREPEYFDEPMPQVGDYVDHRQFGICRVQRSVDDAIVIKLPSGRTKQIKLTVLEVKEPRQDTNRVIYPLVPRKR